MINTLISKTGNVCTKNAQKARVLFDSTCIATAPCRLNSIDPVTYPIPNSALPCSTSLPPLFDTLTPDSVKGTVFDCAPMKAPGPDGIQNWIWHTVWLKVSHHITFLFKMITLHGIIPQDWKTAKMVMLPKPGKPDYTAPGAYRPITLLNTLSKIFEKHLTTTLSGQFESNHLHHSGHYGCRPHHSSQEAMVHLTSWIQEQWAKGKIVGALFADVRSAFPSVHHPRLLDTLQKKGVHAQIINLINLIHEFLSNRSTRLSFNGYDSDPFELTHGLPQGSSFSPPLYLIYNNSLLEIADRLTYAEGLGFIDDVVLLAAANDTHQLKSCMQTLALQQM